jgi:hypothetical protein
MSDRLILEKLSNLEKQSDNLNEKVDKIETAVGLIAVQSERIDSLQTQVQTLWIKYDEVFKPDGTVSMIKQFQAGCPRDLLKDTLKQQWKVINRLWWAIGLLTTIVTGCLMKVLGMP